MCYTKRIDIVMNGKFGESFLELKKVELESIFSTLSDQDKSEILDLNKIYTSNLESEPKFIGNDNLISNYLKSIIQFKEKAETFFDIINLTIDEKGNVID